MESIYRQRQQALIRIVGTRKEPSAIQQFYYSNAVGTEQKSGPFIVLQLYTHERDTLPGRGLIIKKTRQGNKTVKHFLILSGQYFQSKKFSIMFLVQNRLPKDSFRSPKCLVISSRLKREANTFEHPAPSLLTLNIKGWALHHSETWKVQSRSSYSRLSSPSFLSVNKQIALKTLFSFKPCLRL